MRLRPIFSAALAALLLLPALAWGQASSGRSARRADLQAALADAERSAASTAYSPATRARAQREAEVIRRRLRDGDFRVGDRILFRMQGQDLLINDTLAVTDSITVIVPNVRSVSLVGVLRSELDSALIATLSQSVRAVQVRARPLVRVAVFGLVTSPGYYSVPSETLIDQLLSLAGGPTADAAPDRMKLMRADTVLAEGRAVQAAIAAGSTLDALDVRDGDALEVVRRKDPWSLATTLSVVTLLLSLPVAITVLRQ